MQGHCSSFLLFVHPINCPNCISFFNIHLLYFQILNKFPDCCFSLILSWFCSVKNSIVGIALGSLQTCYSFIQNYPVIHHVKSNLLKNTKAFKMLDLVFIFFLSSSSWLISAVSLLPWAWNLRLLFFFPPLITLFSSTALHQSYVITMLTATPLQPRQNLFLMLNLRKTTLMKSFLIAHPLKLGWI